MKLEFFYAPDCANCAENQEKLKQAAYEVDADLEWRELNVLENMDYAVALGVLTLPAMVIDGTLEFPSLPNVKQLVEAMTGRRAPERF